VVILTTPFALVCYAASGALVQATMQQAESLALAGYHVDLYLPATCGVSQAKMHPFVRLRILPGMPDRERASMAASISWLHVCLLMAIAQIQNHYRSIQYSGPVGSGIFTLWLARLLGARIILMVDEARPERIMAETSALHGSFATRYATFIEQLAVDFATHIITTTEPLRARYISRGADPDSLTVIYRLPDPLLYPGPLPVARHPEVAQRFIIAAVAMPDKQGDWATLVRAVASIRTRTPDLLLWILCDQTERQSLDRLVRDLHMTHHILIQDRLSASALPAFLAQADVVIDATLRDPLVDLTLTEPLLGALVLGKPVIAVRSQATFSYFDTQAIMTYEQGDIGELASQLAHLLIEPAILQRMQRHARRAVTQIGWNSESERYVAAMLIVSGIVPLDITQEPAIRPPSFVRRRPIAAGQGEIARKRSVMGKARLGVVAYRHSVPLSDNLPLRITPLSSQWRVQRRFQMRLGAWTLRGATVALLVGIPLVASSPNIGSKMLTIILFSMVAFLLILLPSGEAAIILALYFVAQRALFIRFPPEGLLGPVLVYMGTALQLLIFASFCIRAIVQQRPLLRSGFVIWPAVAYIGISLFSAFINRVPIVVTFLGIEHTLHNLVFVILIAEDLPTPQQLRRYVITMISILAALASLAIFLSILSLLAIYIHLPLSIHWLLPNSLPVALVEPDADSFAYLLNMGILLTLAVLISLNSPPELSYEDEDVSPLLNILLISIVSVLTLALSQTISVENWLGLLGGTIALIVILRGRLRFTLLGYAGLLILLAWMPVHVGYGHNYVTIWNRLSRLGQGDLLHHAPLDKTLTVIHDHIIFGVGPGRFGGTVAALTHSPLYTDYHFSLQTTLHSINLYWLHICGETGILGFLTLIWLMAMTAVAIWRVFRQGVNRQWHGITAGVFGILIAMCIATIWDNALEIDSLSAPFWGLVGIAVALPVASRARREPLSPVLRLQGEIKDNRERSSPAASLSEQVTQ
jgi:glycosyltransferase involved in cell wall biosynthesis